MIDVDTLFDPITVGIVDDHIIVREGLDAVLTRSGIYRVVFSAETAAQALLGFSTSPPDIVLIDLGIEGGGLEVLQKIKSTHPSTLCVIFTSCDDPTKALVALALGAEGYILKGAASGELLRALDSIIARKTYVSPDFATRLVSAVNTKPQNGGTATDLSYRERQVICEVEKGKTNREVAIQLKLSEQTIKCYMSSAMQKLGASNRVGAVREFQRQMGQFVQH